MKFIANLVLEADAGPLFDPWTIFYVRDEVLKNENKESFWSYR